MNRKISQLLQPSFLLYFAFLVLFAIISAWFSPYLAAVEGVIVILLALYYRQNHRRRRREIVRYIENVTGNMDTASKDTMVNAPLPMLIFRPESGDIIWSNDLFLKLTDNRDHLFDAKLSAVTPDFDTRWLMEGKGQCPTNVYLGDRCFQVYGQLVRTQERGVGGFLATTYWVDITELTTLRQSHADSRPVAAILLIDNYEDLMKNLTENIRASILSEINIRLDAWVAGTNGILRKYERERYLLIFEEKHLAQLTEKKFEILEAIQQVQNPSGLAATLSIGVGKGGEHFYELLQFANLSIEMALSRGGDQAVIRNQFTFEFYGGRSTETEKRTKVKSRVMANALSALISDSSHIFVMGHKFPDMDVVGAAVGVCAIARKKGVPVYIIKETGYNPAQNITEKLLIVPEYANSFIAAQDALLMADSRSLVVVVDTNRPDKVQSEQLLQSCNRVAVIDHHRRAATYIEGAALNYHETYASSACELVTELLQYIVEPADLLRIEAEALLAGLVLDTKNFTMRTGGRTFEAAAFLRRSGADTSEVKKLFQNNLEDTVAKYDIIQNVVLYRQHIAIAAVEHEVERVTAAQASDELLNIMGIHSSFVLFPSDDQIVISARSMNETNVQVILEPLGGGGNPATAGAQVANMSLDEVRTAIIASIDKYLDKT